MKTWIIIIGNEILVGRILDTNSHWLSKRLTDLGYSVERIVVVPDREKDIIEVFNEACNKSDIIISCGGLGPTYDDITSMILAKLLRRKWVINQDALEIVRKRLERFNLDLNEYRVKMAKMPEGAIPLENRIGVAPGIFIECNGKMIFALPGVPEEMKYIYENHVEKILIERFGRKYYVEKKITIEGYPESTIAPILDRLAREYPDSYIKSHPRGVRNNKPIVDIVVAIWRESRKEAEDVAQSILKRLEKEIVKINKI